MAKTRSVRNNRTPSGFDFGEARVKEIRRVLLARYGIELPDDDAGRADLQLMLRHLAHLPRGDRRMANYIDLQAPWLTAEERKETIAEAQRSRPPWFTADQLARELNLTYEERTRIGLTTIGAVDCCKEQREKRRRERANERAKAKRAAQGKKTRPVYIATSLAQTKPWEKEGISERTWYRRRSAK